MFCAKVALRQLGISNQIVKRLEERVYVGKDVSTLITFPKIMRDKEIQGASNNTKTIFSKGFLAFKEPKLDF